MGNKQWEEYQPASCLISQKFGGIETSDIDYMYRYKKYKYNVMTL